MRLKNTRELQLINDDIIQLIEKYHWVSDYEIFIHSLSKLDASISNGILNFNQTKLNGFSIKIISKQNKLLELSSSTSRIDILASLKEPINYSQIVSNNKFTKLEKPKILSVMGDGSIDYDTELDILPILMSTPPSELDKQFTREIVLQRENRLVHRMNGEIMLNQSLHNHLTSSITEFNGSNIIYSTSNKFLRDSNIKFNTLESLVLEKHKDYFLMHQTIQSTDVKGVIYHPSILCILISKFMNLLKFTPTEKISVNWNTSLTIYDDPQKISGYNSIIFDDRGNICQSKLLMENGEIVNTFSLKNNSDITLGNLFRQQKYQPLNRHYSYSAVPNFTNIVVYGGLGDGNKFHERSGKIFEILEGTVHLFGDINNLEYVIYIEKGNILKNGEKIAYVSNGVSRGSLNNLMSLGQISNNRVHVYDHLNHNSIYGGWIYLKSEFVNLS